jgi:hypothetical protein
MLPQPERLVSDRFDGGPIGAGLVLGLTHKTIRAQRLHHHRCCTFHQDFRAGSSYNKPQQATSQTNRLRFLVCHPYELIRQTQGLRQNVPEGMLHKLT